MLPLHDVSCVELGWSLLREPASEVQPGSALASGTVFNFLTWCIPQLLPVCVRFTPGFLEGPLLQAIHWPPWPAATRRPSRTTAGN